MKNIPKLIHYCWFGNQPKPKYVKYHIAGWKNILPDYQIIEWSESNFDININKYVSQAYKEKKFAFVSDYARLYAMYHHGGIYLDTDVEVLKPFDDLLENEVVFGFELNDFVATSTFLARKNSVFIGDFMKTYDQRVFVNIDNSLDLTTNVKILTDLLESIGLIKNSKRQRLIYKAKENVLVIEQKYLSPFDYNNNLYYTDSTTFAVHHYSSSWSSPSFRLKIKLKDSIVNLIGLENSMKVTALLKRLFL